MPDTDAKVLFGAVTVMTAGPTTTPWKIRTKAAGTNWGNPEAQIAQIASMLMDGNKAKVTRYGNREIVLELQITGATLDIVSLGEAALMAEVNKGRNTVVWTPPGITTPSVFDVIYSDPSYQFDDIAEGQNRRTFTLTLVCLPFARRADPTVTIASPIPAGAPTITSINNCTSLTGWTTVTTVAAVISGTIRIRGTELSPPFYATGTVTASYTLAAGEYAVWELKLPVGRTPAFSFNGGAVVGVVKATEAVAGGSVRYYVSPSSSSFAVTSSTATAQDLAPGEDLVIYDLSKYSKLPLIGAGFQRMFNATVGGTARTSADILIECASGAFVDEALIYTSKSVALPPPMRGWKTAGDTTSLDAVMVSGGRNTFTTPTVFTIPANLISPGTHSMVARLSGAGADTTMSWTVKTLTTHATASTTVNGSIELTMAPSGYADFELGTLELPTVNVDPTTAGNLEITLASSLSAISLDELWLFNLDDGVLTWIRGLTTSPTRIVIRSATIDSDRPGWFIGTAGTPAADISVAERCPSNGVHQFEPGDLTIFVATLGSSAVTTTLTSYERYRHHVPPVAA